MRLILKIFVTNFLFFFTLWDTVWILILMGNLCRSFSVCVPCLNSTAVLVRHPYADRDHMTFESIPRATSNIFLLSNTNTHICLCFFEFWKLYCVFSFLIYQFLFYNSLSLSHPTSSGKTSRRDALHWEEWKVCHTIEARGFCYTVKTTDIY